MQARDIKILSWLSIRNRISKTTCASNIKECNKIKMMKKGLLLRHIKMHKIPPSFKTVTVKTQRV